jgi:hypothetical protein
MLGHPVLTAAAPLPPSLTSPVHHHHSFPRCLHLPTTGVASLRLESMPYCIFLLLEGDHQTRYANRRFSAPILPQFLSCSAPTPSLFILLIPLRSSCMETPWHYSEEGVDLVAVQLDLFSGSGEFLSANIWFPFCCVGGFQWCVCYDVRKLNLREGSRDWNRKFLCYFLRCEETDPGAGGGGLESEISVLFCYSVRK